VIIIFHDLPWINWAQKWLVGVFITREVCLGFINCTTLYPPLRMQGHLFFLSVVRRKARGSPGAS
jgi:hypothetical protein